MMCADDLNTFNNNTPVFCEPVDVYSNGAVPLKIGEAVGSLWSKVSEKAKKTALRRHLKMAGIFDDHLCEIV